MKPNTLVACGVHPRFGLAHRGIKPETRKGNRTKSRLRADVPVCPASPTAGCRVASNFSAADTGTGKIPKRDLRESYAPPWISTIRPPSRIDSRAASITCSL